VVDTNELRGLIAKNGLTQNKIAEILGISPKTFYAKMAKGDFRTTEAEIMIKILRIDNPISIFFGNAVSS
jgi:DNA-binding XRE family transcriptional regulator